MTVQAWIITTSAQRDDAEALNGPDAMVEGREINNTMANSLGEGVLVGKFVLPARLLNDPSYQRWAEASTDFPDGMGVLPIRTMDSEVLFLPPPED